MPAPGSREKSDTRRLAVLNAAVACVARRGFYGTTTNEIAQAAGISQPYLYRLFENKVCVFAQAVAHVSKRMSASLVSHMESGDAEASSRRDPLRGAQEAYEALIEDRETLRFLMHANCATDEPIIADAVRSCYAKQFDVVAGLMHRDEEAIRQWFGAGMLQNVVIALQLNEVDSEWARVLAGR